MELRRTLIGPNALGHSAWTTGSSPVVTSRGSMAMTSLVVVAMPLRTRALQRQKSQAKKSPPLKKEGRRSADRRTIGPHRQAMRRAPFLLSSHCGRTEVQDFIKPWTSKKWSGRARLSAPHRGIRGFFGLGSAQAALPGTTGCKREDPLRHQCSEHLAVRHAPDGTMPKPPASAVYRRARREPLPLRPKEYPRDGDVPVLDITLPWCHYDIRHLGR